MSDIIILTCKIQDGERLKKCLCSISNEYKDVPCYTKQTLTSSSNCRFIFSTWNMPLYSKEEIIQKFPSLECIFYAAGTVKYFAEPFLNNGIRVFSSASANGVPVAEFTAAQIILANKGYFQSVKRYRWPMLCGNFTKIRNQAALKAGNYGTVVGILGCGNIGGKVIELLQSYNLNFLVYDPYVSKTKLEKLNAERVDLEYLFRNSDVISNHLPDTEQTRGLIDYSLLSLMKSTSTFINTGRGRQVVEKDLVKVLRNNKNMCALLDVTAHEPIFPWSPLYYCRNVFISPHIAGSMSGEFNRMVKQMVEAKMYMENGKDCPWEVKL